MPRTIADTVANLASWLYVLIALAGVGFTAPNLKRSRWSSLFFAGFLIQAILRSVLNLAVPWLSRHSPGDIPRFFIATSVIGLVPYAALVVAAAGSLSDVTRHGVSARHNDS